MARPADTKRFEHLEREIAKISQLEKDVSRIDTKTEKISVKVDAQNATLQKLSSQQSSAATQLTGIGQQLAALLAKMPEGVLSSPPG